MCVRGRKPERGRREKRKEEEEELKKEEITWSDHKVDLRLEKILDIGSYKLSENFPLLLLLPCLLLFLFFSSSFSSILHFFKISNGRIFFSEATLWIHTHGRTESITLLLNYNCLASSLLTIPLHSPTVLIMHEAILGLCCHHSY